MDNSHVQILLSADSVAVAKLVLGWKLYVEESDGTLTGGMIVETEAYHQDDAASHSFKGKTTRTEVMFGSAGHAYVYFSYGMHWCVNIVTGKSGIGEAVLIRAILPERGLRTMRKRRHGISDNLLTNGPAKLCQALAITGIDNGLEFNKSRLRLVQSPLPPNFEIFATKRIGITKDTHRLWRFVATRKNQ